MAPAESNQTHPVAIIGGGPVGLSSSILLSLRGIKNVLFERYPDTSIHPKACGINQRTTEIFRQMGIEDEVYKHAAPPEIAGRTAWYTSLGPDGREIVSRDAWGGGAYEEEYKKHSPSRYCVVPQIRLEPILKRRAIELNASGIKYNSEVLDFKQFKDHVALKVRGRDGTDFEVKARYVIAADGGRSMVHKLGLSWIGEHNIVDMVSVHFKSPLRALHPDPRNFITWFINPELGGSMKTGYLYQVGPWPYEPANEEWVFACAITDKDPRKFDLESLLKRMRETLRIPDLPLEILSFSHWFVNMIFAERYRVDRMFLVGDAAHKIPPWGALGMNTGIQDAQNLVWKLELALKDEKSYNTLLDTYETERLPLGRRVGLSSLHNMRSHSLNMDVALGLSVDKSVEENKRNIAPTFDPEHPEYRAKKAAIDKAQKVLNTEFKAPGAEVGWFYPSVDKDNEGGKLHDGQLLPNGDLNTEFYIPTTIPGHHCPHAWLQKGDQRRAVYDLIPLSQLLLVARGPEWEELGDERVHYEIIGEGGWTDVDGAWATHCNVGEDGAVLVRPDGIIAWRGRRQGLTAETFKAIVDDILYCPA